MDLFTYLGAKNGKFTLPHKSDLFSYLLGKNSKLPIQTASGTTLEITAKKTNVLELTLDKMCSQDGTPTPDNPIEVNVAEGYRNLLPIQNGTVSLNGITISVDNGIVTINGTSTASQSFKLTNGLEGKEGNPESDWLSESCISNKNNTTLSLKHISGTGATSGCAFRLFADSSSYLQQYYPNQSEQTTTFSTDGGISCLTFFTTNGRVFNNYKFAIQLVEGTELKPYVPYGTNYINLNITDGVNSINKQIPLNDNFIGGIGDYKDVLTIDESGSISLVKNIGKTVLNGSESWTFASSSDIKFRLLISNAINFIDDQKNAPLVFTNRYQPFAWNSASSYTNGVTANTGQLKYLCFKNGDITTLEAWQTDLATNNIIVYYPLETPTTTLLGNIDISLFKGSNIITNSDNCNMTIKYY